MKKVRFLLALALLIAVLIFGALETEEALAVGPCETVCNDASDCLKNCVCETPEWGARVMPCGFCSFIPNNPCF